MAELATGFHCFRRCIDETLADAGAVAEGARWIVAAVAVGAGLLAASRSRGREVSRSQLAFSVATFLVGAALFAASRATAADARAPLRTQSGAVCPFLSDRLKLPEVERGEPDRRAVALLELPGRHDDSVTLGRVERSPLCVGATIRLDPAGTSISEFASWGALAERAARRGRLSVSLEP